MNGPPDKPMLEQPARPAWREFAVGVVAGLALIVVSYAVTFLVAAALNSTNHGFAFVWLLIYSLAAFLLFRWPRPGSGSMSAFRAGLVMAFALFLLLDSACWSFTLT
jgi:hypothetical protein